MNWRGSMNNIEKEIREVWFENHEAKLKEIDDIGQALVWKERGTNVYKVVYYMIGNKLFISGDLDDAVFDLTWQATLESFQGINLRNFHSKLSAIEGDEWGWSNQEAVNYLEEKISYLSSEFNAEEVDEKHIKILEKMKKVASFCQSAKGWENDIAYVGNDTLFDRLQEYDPDCWEWVFSIGKVIPKKVVAYWVGLQMAYKQLEKEG